MKRFITVLLTVLLVFCAAAQAAETDSYIATAGAILDQSVYPGSMQQSYMQILNGHYSRIRAYQDRTLEYYNGSSQVYVPCRPVALTDLTGDGIPELIFIEVANAERGDLYIYSSDGTRARCAEYVPGITRLGYDDVGLGFSIYETSDAGGTLVIRYFEFEKPWTLQLKRTALDQYYLVSYLTYEFDPSGESYDDRFYRNGALITAGEYDSAIAYMENGRTLTVSDYIAPDQSHYGLDMTWEDAAGKLNGSGVVTPEPTAAPNPGGAIYGLTINKLATRTGPGTQYAEGGTYNVKGQYIQVLARAYDTRNGIWWVKCVIPYKGENRVLWTGYKRFDHSQLPLESIPIESGW